MKLPDLLRGNPRVVFCGTRAGETSARLGQYYAGPGNQFWRILFKIGLTPRIIAPQEYRILPQFGIGLTDLVKQSAGSDQGLRGADFDGAGLRRNIERAKPWILAFNGKRAAEAFLGRPVQYGLQPERIGKTEIFVLPSTSGAARGYWDESFWRELAIASR